MQWESDKQGEKVYLSDRWKTGSWCSENAVLLKWGLLTVFACPWGRFLECRAEKSLNLG
jgi:hypothetical protein